MPALAGPIVDYATLQAAIAAWVDRSDFTTVTPVLIGLAHARLTRVLRVNDMGKRTTAPVAAGSEFVDLPNDFLEMKRARPVTNPVSNPLNVMTTDQLGLRLGENLRSTVPTDCALFGTQLQLAPAPSGDFTLEMLYYAQIPLLSDSAPTNWLLTKWPEAYLYGALVESAPYLRDDERMPLWQSRADAAINEIQAIDERATLAGGKMTNRTRPIA